MRRWSYCPKIRVRSAGSVIESSSKVAARDRSTGREQDAPAARTQDAVELAERTAVVGDVFEQMVADQHVVGGIGKRDLQHVEMQFGQRALQIGRRIVGPPLCRSRFIRQTSGAICRIRCGRRSRSVSRVR